MRTLRLSGLALAATLVLTSLAAAEGPRVEITDMRVGFPGSINAAINRGAKPGRFKLGAWAPLYVDLEVRDAPLTRDSYVLVVETTDSDDLQNVYVERRFLPTIEPRESPTLLTYVRPGNGNSEITVHVQDLHGQDLCKKKHVSMVDLDPREPHVYGYLTLGGRMNSLYKALVSKEQQRGVAANPPPPQEQKNPDDEPADPEENGNRSFAHLDQVQQMPTYWFGYQPVDTVILLTGKQQFADDLNHDREDDPFSVRRDALAEWVRRGGHLIVSVSKNHQEVNQILKQMKVIDLAIDGRTQVPALPGVASFAGGGEFKGLVTKDQKTPIFEVAKLKPGRGVQVLAYDKVGGTLPMIVQAPCGLGRVIVVAFDLDEQPFTGWKRGREEFWKRIKEINEPSNIGEGLRSDRNNWRGNDGNNGGELAGKLVRSLEAFPDVPVVSFGWVALFILVYILIVGPLDYFFLKKVVKRLELTWITFPAVVIVISAVAYFAAYYLKGKDLRINKVDVVDVDLSGGNVYGKKGGIVYGNTWFTLFSPRIQNYTVGVEPGTGWGPEERDSKEYHPFVGWMGRPEEGFYARGGSGSLFRRAYDYAPESSGLVGVPIQVWSTKTFSASWYRPIEEDELVEARLEVAKNDDSKMKLSGTITSHLPVDLRDVTLFYRGKFYALDKLTVGSPLRVDGKMAPAGDPQNWFNQQLGQPNLQVGNHRPGAFNQELPQPIGSYIKSVLFHTYPGDNTQQTARNSGVRFLDQKWRLDVNYREEAILFGRAEPPAAGSTEGNADEVSKSGLSASKLWLGKLPGGGDRPRIDGTLSQDTYVRVYIPVTTK